MTRKEMASTFLTMVSKGNVQPAFDQFVHNDFIHHNAYFKGDGNSLKQAMIENAQEFPHKTYEILRSLEDGDLVSVHGKVVMGPDSQWSVIHIIRFDGDKIAEMWEATQQVLEDSPNEHGIF